MFLIDVSIALMISVGNHSKPLLTQRLDPDVEPLASQRQTSFPMQKSLDDRSNLYAAPAELNNSFPRYIDISGLKVSVNETLSPANESPPVELKDVLPLREKTDEPYVLVTDDNAINRRVRISTRVVLKFDMLIYDSYSRRF